MKFAPHSLTRLAVVALVLILFTALARPATAGELKLTVQLIWGTNEDKSSDAKHKEVDPKVAKKLKKTPFKWEHYYQICTHDFSVKEGETYTKQLSKDCQVKVRNLGKNNVEVQYFGKGDLVSKVSQALTKDDYLVTGGNAANLTAWFVVLRQAE